MGLSCQGKSGDQAALSGSEQALPLGLEVPRKWVNHLALRGKSEAGLLGLRFWPVAAQVTWVGKVAIECAKVREY